MQIECPHLPIACWQSLVNLARDCISLPAPSRMRWWSPNFVQCPEKIHNISTLYCWTDRMKQSLFITLSTIFSRSSTFFGRSLLTFFKYKCLIGESSCPLNVKCVKFWSFLWRKSVLVLTSIYSYSSSLIEIVLSSSWTSSRIFGFIFLSHLEFNCFS